MTTRLLVTAVLLTALLSDSGWAQEPLPSAGSAGIWHQGRYLGFVPAHLSRSRADQTVSNPMKGTPTPAVAPESEPTQPLGTVNLAQFVEADPDPIVLDEPMPELFPPGVVDGLPGVVHQGMGGVAGCGPGYRMGCLQGLWVRGDYLMWWPDEMDFPPLVTTSPAGTAPNLAGILGQPGTQILLGSGDLGGQDQSGGRITIGWWMDPLHIRGLEANYFGLGNRTSGFSANSNDFPILARPIFDTGTNSEAALLIAHPNLLAGAIAVDANTELQGGEVLLRHRMFAGDCRRLDLLLGYRYAQLDESLQFNQSSVWTAAQGAIVVGTRQDLRDSFATDNEFQGANIGLEYQEQIDCWTLSVLMKLGLGNNHSEVFIDGQTLVTVPNGGSATFTGGLLAQETNIGSYQRDVFGVIPELGVTISRPVWYNLQVTFGYNLFYWTSIVRPGDQIDRQVSQFPPETPTGTQQPAFRFLDSNFFAQGLQFGVQYEW